MASAAITSAPVSLPFLPRRRHSISPRAHRTPNHDPSIKAPALLRRRSLSLLLSSAAAVTIPFSPSFPAAASEATSTPVESTTTVDQSSPAVTDRVFMDFSVCPSYLRSVGGKLVGCADEDVVLGRVVFGLYGREVPITVANFKTMCAAAAYRGSAVHKVLPGQFFMAGRQGLGEKNGDIRPVSPSFLQPNSEPVNPDSFRLRHIRPGTLSLCLGENDDDEDIKLDPEYRNVEFLVTTGPGPCPQLDDRNIVFGTVLEGMDVITAIATTTIYKPTERIRQLNEIAEFIGDERAQIARSTFDRPLKTIYISNCGELMVAKPSLSPTLP